MTVTVVPIIEPDPRPGVPLAKVMQERLRRIAQDLQEIHLRHMETVEPLFDDLVVYVSYNSKYAVRWRIVNDVPAAAETMTAEVCAKLGYIKWKTATINLFHSR
jgi:hypothetical protein